jgi:hypothetical protein
MERANISNLPRIMFGARNMMFTNGDADIIAFRAASGATDTTVSAQLTAYLKAQNLWNNTRFYPLKSSQNAGSGSTAYGLGGLTGNNCTLVNSPTWDTSGIVMNATTQYGHISDFLDAETLTVFIRRSGGVGTSLVYFASQWDFAAGERSWALCGTTLLRQHLLRLLRSADGGTTNTETYGTPEVASTDGTYVAQWTSGSGRAAWRDKTSLALTLIAGTAQTARFNSADSILINAAGAVGGVAALAGGTYTAALFIRGSLTTPQREAITDLVNAL